jgi:CubicO group peptidase (beta-lactamase class C family)
MIQFREMLYALRPSVLFLMLSGFVSLLAPPSAPAAGAVDFAGQLESIRKHNHLPAIAAAAVLNGEITELAAVGLRKAGGNEEVTVDDQWHLGSCTKSMTATLAAMLVEQGKIAWHTTINDVFPELHEVIDDDWQGVTLEQLLSHRGGAPAHPPDDIWMRAWQQRGTPTEQRLKFMGGMITRRPETPPGTKFVYSNQGYAIAGAMLERCAGESWEEMMRTMIFEPLGMQSAGFGSPGTEDEMDQPWGHIGWYVAKKLEPVPPGPDADNPPAIGPAGTVHCSISDLARYCAFHAAEGRGGGSTLLQPASFKKLHTREPNEDYALGWVVQKRAWGGGDVVMHTGSNTMWYCAMWVAPEKNAAFVAATNAASEFADDACDEAIKAMVVRTFGEDRAQD